ncbi:DUF4197 domain-containing protein [Neptunomonas antarctica]|uniref:DUF4197 domain-containing protein n=1 Tax=Neptunomonas antarctica TaxID=619304 RepID=A0A1N7LGC7_9GAMM|nr:DUF4197 domain-containing protein [Neptunomonas antarctica]SIS72882.1 Protein of unknown function [Neptunomonas antarctica]
MRKLTISTLLLSATLAASTSHAGWGDLLDSVKKTGGELLQQPAKNNSSTNISSSSLSSETLINGLREALAVGSERAIKLISAEGGYLNDPQIRVPLPAGLDKLAGPLRQFGMGEQVDQFEQSINRAAERAAPQATAILVDNIRSMSFEDARKIYEGSDDAATQYFREKAGPQIAALFKPEVDSALSEVGATRYYNDLASQAAQLPIVGQQVTGDLSSHVTKAALDGLFLKIAAEEKLIRDNPAARTTDLLKQLWSQ